MKNEGRSSGLANINKMQKKKKRKELSMSMGIISDEPSPTNNSSDFRVTHNLNEFEDIVQKNIEEQA